MTRFSENGIIDNYSLSRTSLCVNDMIMSISCGFGCRIMWGSEEAPKQASLVVVVGWDSGAKELFLQCNHNVTIQVEG